MATARELLLLISVYAFRSLAEPPRISRSSCPQIEEQNLIGTAPSAAQRVRFCEIQQGYLGIEWGCVHSSSASVH